MARLPNSGEQPWDSVLNTFLTVAHNADGTLKSGQTLIQSYGAVGDGVTDDTTALQAALNAAHTVGSGTVVGKAGLNYLISAPLVIYSNTTLDLTGCTVTLKASSNCNMLQNAALVAGSGRDSNIGIVGGTWARGANAGVNTALMSIRLQRVDGVVIRDLTYTSSAGKYGISLYACTDFDVGRITLNCASDGVHVSGLSSLGYIHDIYGSAGDDTVAFTPSDNAAYQNGDLGDITDMTVERIFTTGTGAGRGVSIYAEAGYNTRRIAVRDVGFDGSATNAVGLAGTGGTITDILIDRVVNKTGGSVLVGDGTSASVTLANINIARVGSIDGVASAPIVIQKMTVRGLQIRDCNFTSTGAANPVFVQGAAVIEDLTFRNVFFNPSAGLYGVALTGSSTLTTVRFVDCRLKVQTVSAGLLLATAAGNTLGTITVKNLTIDQAAWGIGDFNNVTPTILLDTLTGAGPSNGLLNIGASATVTFKLAVGLGSRTVSNSGTVNGGHLIGVGFKTSPTYSASITPDCTKGAWQTITVTNGTAFTINAPINPPGSSDSSDLTVEISNTSGGAMGVITWNAAFKLVGGAFTNPATGNKRFITFRWNGTAWVEIARAAADYT